jgi:hypothetical protein
MTDLDDLWHLKSDAQLREAFIYRDEYSEESQAALRAEFTRRGLAEPSHKSITCEEAKGVARLYRLFAGLVGAQWLLLGAIVFISPIIKGDVGALVGLLCVVLLLVTLIAAPVTGYRLLKRLEVESPGGLALVMYAPLFSLLTLFGMRAFMQRWSKEYGVEVGFLGPDKGEPGAARWH